MVYLSICMILKKQYRNAHQIHTDVLFNVSAAKSDEFPCLVLCGLFTVKSRHPRVKRHCPLGLRLFSREQDPRTLDHSHLEFAADRVQEEQR